MARNWRAGGPAIALLVASMAPADAGAERAKTTPAPERAPRRADATWDEIVAGPFRSSRLFSMPAADVVGAFLLSITYEGTLLQEQGALTSAGVVALGFGDIAQLEYRSTSAIGLDGADVALPTLGLQLQAPLPEGRGWPAVAGALRFGVNRSERFGDTAVDQSASDLYAVVSWPLWGPLEGAAVHAGLRVSSATLTLSGSDLGVDKTLLLPTVGAEVRAAPDTRLIAEVGLVPAFELDLDATDPVPAIGTALTARAGVRWQLHPLFTFDASFGYQLESSAVGTAGMGGADAITDYDIRLGGELFIPWGAISCRVLGAFCE